MPSRRANSAVVVAMKSAPPPVASSRTSPWVVSPVQTTEREPSLRLTAVTLEGMSLQAMMPAYAKVASIATPEGGQA